MAKKKAVKKAAKKMAATPERIVFRSGESLVEGGADCLCAEPEVIIGELDGPVGIAIANQMAGQVKGHTKVFAILNSDVQIRPVTLMVSKVTVESSKYTNILMGTVQAAIAHGVLDAVRAGDIPKSKANELGVIVAVWLDPAATKEAIDHEQLFKNHREAVAKAIKKAMGNQPDIDWLLKNQDTVPHFYHQLGVEGKL